MNASPAPVSRFPSGRFALPAPAETVLALLRGVEDRAGDWEGLAATAALDPVLSIELLRAVPAPVRVADFDLHRVLAQTMAQLGGDLLRAWCLSQLAPRSPGKGVGDLLRASMHGLFVAELALHLAVETRQGGLQEAYAAGLFHDIGASWLACHVEGQAALRATVEDERALSAAEIGCYGVSHAAVGGVLATRCGLPANVADAIHLHHCAPQAIADAAPLARVLWLAEEVAGPRFELSEHDLGAAAEVSGLDAATLIGLRTDVARRLSSLTGQFGIAGAPAPAFDAGEAMQAAPVAAVQGKWGGETAVAAAAICALARIAVRDAEQTGHSMRLRAACRLLLDLESPLLLEWDAVATQLHGLSDDERPWAAELTMQIANSGSVVARAWLDRVATQGLSGAAGPQQSAADWHLARRIGAEGLLCEPWADGERCGVAVFGLDAFGAEDRIGIQVRKALVEAAAHRIAWQRRKNEIRREAEQELRARYREHYRRLTHEASNPLAVLKTYLAVIRERGAGDAIRAAELVVMDKELDRVASLVRGMALPPGVMTPEYEGKDQPRVEVCGLLDDLQVLYGETLFVARGVHFELVSGTEPLWAAIPRDALKQVLLNLFKNAAEALPSGRHFAAVVIPVANVGGVRCVGIRLSDDGSGVSRAAMSDLFAEPQTSKGGDHLGVGLVVVREILARHGGSVVCESDSHTGTVFSVYIPVAEPG